MEEQRALEAPCDFNAEQSHSDEADGGRVGGDLEDSLTQEGVLQKKIKR